MTRMANNPATFLQENLLEERMQTIRKADGFEAQKLLVLPDKLLEDISCRPLIKPLYVTDIGFFPSARFHY